MLMIVSMFVIMTFTIVFSLAKSSAVAEDISQKHWSELKRRNMKIFKSN